MLSLISSPLGDEFNLIEIDDGDRSEFYMVLAMVTGETMRDIKDLVNGSLTEWAINFISIEKCRTLKTLGIFCSMYCSPNVIELIVNQMHSAIKRKQDTTMIVCERREISVCCCVKLIHRAYNLRIDAQFLAFERNEKTKTPDLYKSPHVIKELTERIAILNYLSNHDNV